MSGYEQTFPDDFVLTMKRAAEKAAPQAKGIFFDTIMGMTLDRCAGIIRCWQHCRLRII